MKTIANAKPIPTPSFADEDAADGLTFFRAIAEPDRRNANGIAHQALRQPKPDPRGFRWQVRVWLDANKPDQLDLGKWIYELKCKKTFAPILRNALSLYRELIAGETAMLYQLFPDIKPTPPPLPAKEIEDLQKKVNSLEDQVELLKGILIKQSGPGAVDMGVKMAGQGGPKPLAMNKAVAAPMPDDDDDSDMLVVRKDVNAGYQSGINFIKSAFALNGMSYEETAQ